MKEGAQNELPGGWVWTRLRDIIIKISNGITKRQTKDNTGLMVTRIETISNGTIDLSRVGYLKDLSSEEIEKYRLFPGDILFSHINSDLHLGKTAIFCSNSLTLLHGMNLLLIRPNENLICPKILHHLCIHYRYAGSFISIAQHAVNQSSINQLNLRNISIPLPPLPEQRAIVSKIEQLFSDLDNGIENFKKAQAQLKLYRQSVLKAACEGKLVPIEAELARTEGRDYEAADVLLARILKERREKWNGKGKYKEAAEPDTNDLPVLKDGWCWVETNMICNTITDGDHQPPPQSEKGIPFLVISNIKEGKLDFNQTRFVPEYYYQSIQEHRIPKKGDILYSVVGSYGIPAMVDVDRKFCFQRHIALFKPSEFIHDRYMLLALKSNFTFRQATALATGTAQLTVSLSGLRRIKIPLPPLAEQRRIVAEVERRLSVCDKMEAIILESLQKADSLRQSILKKAFEGKLLNKKDLEKARNASDWEPAEKLLERIRQEKERTGGEEEK